MDPACLAYWDTIFGGYFSSYGAIFDAHDKGVPMVSVSTTIPHSRATSLASVEQAGMLPIPQHWAVRRLHRSGTAFSTKLSDRFQILAAYKIWQGPS